MKYKKKTLFNFITKEYLVIMKNKKRTYLTTHPFKSLIGISFFLGNKIVFRIAIANFVLIFILTKCFFMLHNILFNYFMHINME